MFLGSGSRGRDNWGMNRRWYGDYLSKERMPAEYLLTIQDIRNKDGANNIVFSSKVKDPLFLMFCTSGYSDFNSVPYRNILKLFAFIAFIMDFLSIT